MVIAARFSATNPKVMTQVVDDVQQQLPRRHQAGFAVDGGSLPGIGTSGGSRRNCVHPSFGPAWKQVKLVPRTI